LKFGLWYHFRNPPQWAKPWDRLYADLLEQIEAAEALGYDSVWMSEHHFADDGYLPSSLLVLAAVAARTRRVRLGTLVLLLPLHHPLRVAEDAAVLDILSGGRLDLGVAAGYRVAEFDGFGIPHGERGSRIDEAVQVLQKAWSDAPVSFQGRHFRFENVNVTPKPLQKPLPLYMGGQSPAAIRRAARLACHLLPSSTTAFDVLGTYRRTLEEHGRDPRAFKVKCFRALYCCEDSSRGWDDVKEHFLYQHNLYRRWYREAGDSDAPDLENADELPRGSYIVGTPDDCARAIAALRAEAPYDEFIFWATPPGLAVEKSTRSVQLFAKEVFPRFREE